jgi:hypothetical protein
VGFEESRELGELLPVSAAIAEGGSVTSLGIAAGETVLPSPRLTGRIERALGGDGQAGTVASFDGHPGEQAPEPGVVAADMQTAPLLALACSLAVEAAAVLIVAEIATGEKRLERDALEAAEKRAGRAAAAALSA